MTKIVEGKRNKRGGVLVPEDKCLQVVKEETGVVNRKMVVCQQ